MEDFIHDRYGYCYFVIEPDREPVIFNLFTEPQYRRQGHARRHLQYIVDEIRRSGYTGEIGIEVVPRENSIRFENLVLFYESMGLEVIRT